MPILRVTLLSAHDLAASDFNGKSDPYIVLQCGKTKKKSSCIRKDLNPKWQPAEIFEFDVASAAINSEILSVSVFDHDTFNQDDLLGAVNLPLTRFGTKPAIENYSLDVPTEFAKQNRKSTIQLEIALKLNDDGEKVLQMWENESWVPGKGWIKSDNPTRMNWSSYDGKITHMSFKLAAPEVPSHLEGKGWSYSTAAGDSQGWLYASTTNGPWSNSGGPLCFVRRRLWENQCTPISSNNQ